MPRGKGWLKNLTHVPSALSVSRCGTPNPKGEGLHNRYVVYNLHMAIPKLEDRGGAHKYLPPGNHPATLDEVERVFGASTIKRRELMGGLREVVSMLRAFGVTVIYVDGSFISDKARPRDIDVIYDKPADADTSKWGPLAPTRRETAARRFGCDLWEHPSYGTHGGGPRRSIKKYFERDDDDILKGHILLRSSDDQE